MSSYVDTDDAQDCVFLESAGARASLRKPHATPRDAWGGLGLFGGVLKKSSEEEQTGQDDQWAGTFTRHIFDRLLPEAATESQVRLQLYRRSLLPCVASRRQLWPGLAPEALPRNSLGCGPVKVASDWRLCTPRSQYVAFIGLSRSGLLVPSSFSPVPWVQAGAATLSFIARCHV